MILALRTDKPEAELYLYEDTKCVAKVLWRAHRELSLSLLGKIEELLATQSKTPQDLTGVVIFQGPGSFTGLRIGVTVANTLAYSMEIPIVGAVGESWISQGLIDLTKQDKPQIIIPHYGAKAHITQQKK